jgi:hypothetical protein
MKYKIKITTYLNGRKIYHAYFRAWWGWTGLDSQGGIGYATECDSREQALKRIDQHFNGNTTVQNIQFEYINKLHVH